MTPLEQLLALVQAKNWLPLVLLATLVVRKWVSYDSRFPISIPKTWQPTITAAGGLVYGALLGVQSGQSVGASLLGMAVAAGAGGFLDGMLVAIFDHDNAPVWARSIVFIFDDLTGQTPVSGAAKERLMRSVRPPPASVLPEVNPQPSIPITVKESKPPKALLRGYRRGDLFLPAGPSDGKGWRKWTPPEQPKSERESQDLLNRVGVGLIGLVMFVMGCTQCSGATVPAGSPVDVGIDTGACILRVSIEDELAGMKPEAIVLDCIAKCGATAAQVVKMRDAYASARALERSRLDGGK